MNKKPNILWIMTDQLQAGCLGFMGHPIVKTPNLDKLANESYVFENAYTQSPVCMAARGCLFTGRYPASIRIRGMGVLPPSETTTPEIYKRNGYRTGAFGKVHLTPEQYTKHTLQSDIPIIDYRAFAEPAHITLIKDDPFKLNYGFDEHIGCDDANRGNHIHWLRQVKPELADKKHIPDPSNPINQDLYVSPYPSEYHHSTFIALMAESFIEQNKDKPWFTFCSFIHPHHPFEAPADQIAKYRYEDIQLPHDRGEPEPSEIPEPVRSGIGEYGRMPEDIRVKIRQHYYASISLIDDCVGKLIDALNRTGQMENTIIIFTADHGEHLGEHGLVRKASIHYDEIIKVPLFIRVPGHGSSPRRIDGLVETIDLHPTLLGLSGLPVNAGVQGIDWSEKLRQGDEIGRDDIYSDQMLGQSDFPITGPYLETQTIRTIKWKLNLYPKTELRYGQLFDLENDPGETLNLYNQAAYKAIREELLFRIIKRLAANLDPLPVVLSQY